MSPNIEQGASLLSEALKVGIHVDVMKQQEEGNGYRGCHPDLPASGFSGVMAIWVKQKTIWKWSYRKRQQVCKRKTVKLMECSAANLKGAPFLCSGTTTVPSWKMIELSLCLILTELMAKRRATYF